MVGSERRAGVRQGEEMRDLLLFHLILQKQRLIFLNAIEELLEQAVDQTGGLTKQLIISFAHLRGARSFDKVADYSSFNHATPAP